MRPNNSTVFPRRLRPGSCRECGARIGSGEHSRPCSRNPRNQRAAVLAALAKRFPSAEETYQARVAVPSPPTSPTRPSRGHPSRGQSGR